jgi:hypothetical protein
MSRWNIGGNAGAPTLTGLQAPEEAKEIPVPPDKRVGTDNRQELTPFDVLRQEDKCDSRGVVRAVRSDLAFDVTGKLLPEEQVLGRQLRSRADHQPQQAQ